MRGSLLESTCGSVLESAEATVWPFDRNAGQLFGGRRANGGFNPLYQIGGPRSVQLAVKLLF
jgi:hypothetical protein